ncbi:MAG TPA: hypothetical protein DEB05_02215 [Firmicutes bacterium]|jgi:putative nucleotidyltransferase with HDIG domain|nr:hypothetical protein [Bacillota bacterium]HBT15756.1 hypothetical protein [Bacillota bacterium]
MRYLPLEEINEEMFLAHAIFSNDGKILLNKGTRLTPSYVRRLRDMHYSYLYVYERKDEKWDCTGPISDNIRSEAMGVLWNSLISVIERRALNTQQITFVLEGILRDVLQRQDGLFDIIDIKTPDNYIYNHSINVCILSILMGRQLKLERDQLKELAIGAFLHDLGKVYLKSSLKKLEELSTQDIAQIKQHTKKGFDILRTTPGFTIKIANIAYQHHEREDGSGYPLGLIGEDIPLYSKIVALADSYDAMVSKRIYRESLWNDQVLIELEKETPRKYDPEVVSALRQSVAVYPIGSIVQLSDGQSAVVVEVSSSKTVLQYLEVSAGFSEVRADLETKIEKRLA